MAELALAAAAALGTTTAATAATSAIGAGAAATVAALPAAAFASGAAWTGAAGAASTLSILSGVANAVSAVGAIGSGLMAFQEGNAKADETELQIGQDRVASANRQLQLRRNLYQILGENDVAYAAAGIDISGGLAQSTRQQAERDNAFDLSLERSDDDMRRALLRARVRNYRQSGVAGLGSGLLKAAGIGLNYGIDVAERGLP